MSLEKKATLDYQDLTSKITTLDAKLKDSDSRQKGLERTIKKLNKIIDDLEINQSQTIKTIWTKNDMRLKVDEVMPIPIQYQDM